MLLFAWKLRFPKDLELLFTVLVAIIHSSLDIENIQLNFQAVLFGDGYREDFYWKGMTSHLLFSVSRPQLSSVWKGIIILKNIKWFYIFFFLMSLISHSLTVETSNGKTDSRLQVFLCLLLSTTTLFGGLSASYRKRIFTSLDIPISEGLTVKEIKSFIFC